MSQHSARLQQRIDSGKVKTNPTDPSPCDSGSCEPAVHTRWPRFVVDVMLGRLARWLRLAGLDTLYDPAWDDDVLLRNALRDRRILLTRDRALARRARRMHVQVVEITADRFDAQFQQVCRQLALHPDQLPWFARCPLCNHRIRRIARKRVRDIVPEYVYRTHHTFYICPSCERVYWPGSHYRKVLETRNRWQQREIHDPNRSDGT